MIDGAEKDMTHRGLEQIDASSPYREKLGSALRRVSVFKDFNDTEINTLTGYLQTYRANKDTVIFVEGERTGFMCVLIEGRLMVFKETGKGKSRKIADISAGSTIGEMSLIDGLPHSATAMAAEAAVLAVLTKENLLRIAEEHSALGIRILWGIAQTMSLRLRKTSGMLVEYVE